MGLEQQQPAIRTRVWIAGKTVTRDPVPIQITSKRLEAKTKTANGAMRIDRCYRGAGMPNIPNRREFSLPWPDLREPALLEHVDIVCAIGQPFGLGLWKQEYDIFDGDGDNKSFYIQRRQLLEGFTPDTVFGDYPTRVVLYDKPYSDPTAVGTSLTVVQKPSADIDTGDPTSGEAWIESEGRMIGNLWVSKVRLEAPPPLEFDCLLVIYVPLYEVVVDTEAPRSYAQALVEPRSLKLLEFG